MFFSSRNVTGLSSVSEADLGADAIDATAWVIAELMSQYRIACGKQPAEMVRLTRKLPNGEIDCIEIPVHRKDSKLAQYLLKALFPLVGKLGGKSIAGLELDERERATLSDLLRTYQDGSHPSCRVGK